MPHYSCEITALYAPLIEEYEPDDSLSTSQESVMEIHAEKLLKLGRA